jgi:hypothetical protein
MQLNGLDELISTARPGIERLDVDQFHRMIATGILREGAPIELIDGVLIRKDTSDAGGDPMTHGPRHAYCVQLLKRIEVRLSPFACHLRLQLPITISENCEPEPDVAIVRGAEEDFREAHPLASDCLVAIEVADSSLAYDRTVKASIYASGGVPLFLIINLPDHQIELYRQPTASDQRYAVREIFTANEMFKLELDTESIELRVEELLP